MTDRIRESSPTHTFENSDFAHIGEVILIYRKRRGLTQAQLAKMIKVERTGMSQIENGLQSLVSSRVILVCKALRITPNQLFGWEK